MPGFRRRWPLALSLLLTVGGSPRGEAADPAALELVGREGTARRLDLTALGRLPATRIDIIWRTGQGEVSGSFSGPLLWNLLQEAGLLERGERTDRLRRVVTVTGRGGYAVVLAIGEIAPDFAGKQVIIATHTADGQALRPIAEYPLRLVVPGDRRAGRAVRDVVRVALD